MLRGQYHYESGNMVEIQKENIPAQIPIQWVPGPLSLGITRPRREADHSPPSSAEVRNAWRYTSTPIRLHGLVLI
jgi:hypothetical protein